MRGSDTRTGELFSYVDVEDRVPAKHPLRVVRRIVNEVLIVLDAEFEKIYAATGRPSIPPERLLRALLLQAIRCGFAKIALRVEEFEGKIKLAFPAGYPRPPCSQP